MPFAARSKSCSVLFQMACFLSSHLIGSGDASDALYQTTYEYTYDTDCIYCQVLV